MRWRIYNQSTNITLTASAPYLTRATITPSVVEIGTNVTCSATASDPDDGVALRRTFGTLMVLKFSLVNLLVNSTDASVGDDTRVRRLRSIMPAILRLLYPTPSPFEYGSSCV